MIDKKKTGISHYLRPMLFFSSFLMLAACSETPLATGHLDGDATAHLLKDAMVPGLEPGGYCIEFSDGQSFPLQVVGAKGQAIFIPTVDLPADAHWKILECPAGDGLTSKNADGLLTFYNKDRPIMSFVTEARLPHDTTPAYYSRDGFIHPFYSPGGVELTEDYPRGHTHQHGIFHAWTRSTIKGQMVDFWNQQAELGTIKLVRVGEVEGGPVFASFSADLEYEAFIGADTVLAAREQWIVTVYAGTPKVNMVQITIVHTPVVDSLVLTEYHYGGFGVRASDAWNMEGTSLSPYDSLAYIKTSLGDNHADANHTRPTWISMWGEIEGKTAGLTVLPHPSNFRHPQPVRVHPSMPYFTFAPMVTGEFVLTPDQTYTARFLLLSYDGEPDEDLVEEVRASYK